MHNRGRSRSLRVRTGRCLFHFTIRTSVQRDRRMPTAEAYLDALWNLVTQFLYMMARIKRDGDAVEHQVFAEGVDPSADTEREVEINV